MTRLQTLQPILEEAGLETVLHPGTQDIPLEQLVVTLSELQSVSAHLLVLPPILSVPILQVVIELPVQVYAEHFQDTCQLLCAINARIPVKGFEISDVSDSRVLFRLMIPMLSDTIDSQRIIDTLSLSVGLIRRCFPYIIALSVGRQDYQDALNGVLGQLYN